MGRGRKEARREITDNIMLSEESLAAHALDEEQVLARESCSRKGKHVLLRKYYIFKWPKVREMKARARNQQFLI